MLPPTEAKASLISPPAAPMPVTYIPTRTPAKKAGELIATCATLLVPEKKDSPTPMPTPCEDICTCSNSAGV